VIRLWCVLVAGAMTLVLCVAAAGPAAAAKGGNSENAHRCQKGGWQSLFDANGSRFANQGDCVSYGAQGRTLYASAGQAVCETFGGTFVPDGALLWACNGYAYPAGAAQLESACTTDGGVGFISLVLGDRADATCRRGS
jgi:hypothetical protein